MNIHMQVNVCVPFFNSFGPIARSGIVGSYGNSMFNFLFSTVAVPFYIPISNVSI